MTDLEAAWDELHAALPPGWVAGRPSWIDERRVWEQYAYRRDERPKVGKRHDEWTAVGTTESGLRPRDGAVPAADSRGPLAQVV